ncbi:ankyrin repeat domain-containing protein [Shewanella khirikhana]|uniref:Ankyrin repeats (3 copies) n=1 Tax=Shewanella khirikhana TaxID=1965282 RepID=A0ABM7DPB0_9GAMM|nr:ankyrin repeat domain-containing protein [Shewanella khirikhana]AZQ11505.1 Ankyrin repeats (3 copies) [Shewanella khirikhana]
MKLSVQRWIGTLLAGLLGACGYAGMAESGKNMDAKQFFEPQMVAVLTAISKGDETKAKALLASGVNLNVIGEHKITPLFWFIARHDKEGMQLALKLGAAPNFKSGKGNTPVAYVAGWKNIEWLRLLLQAGGDPNSMNHLKQPALFGAIGEANFDAIDTLLEFGADPNLCDGSGSHAALYASDLNDWELVYVMLQQGSDPYAYDKAGADIAWSVDDILNRKIYTEGSDNYQWLLKVKQYLLEKGVAFPPPSPAEVRTRWAKEGKPGYKIEVELDD